MTGIVDLKPKTMWPRRMNFEMVPVRFARDYVCYLGIICFEVENGRHFSMTCESAGPEKRHSIALRELLKCL
jgi:hypothetical protein